MVCHTQWNSRPEVCIGDDFFNFFSSHCPFYVFLQYMNMLKTFQCTIHSQESLIKLFTSGQCIITDMDNDRCTLQSNISCHFHGFLQKIYEGVLNTHSV